jgi:hypothetical protein
MTNSDIKRLKDGAQYKYDAIMQYINERPALIVREAERGYKEKGRGYFVFFAAPAELFGRTFKQGEYTYFNEQDGKDNGLTDQVRDASLLKRLREYDPAIECIMAAFYGTEYMPLTLRKDKTSGH